MVNVIVIVMVLVPVQENNGTAYLDLGSMSASLRKHLITFLQFFMVNTVSVIVVTVKITIVRSYQLCLHNSQTSLMGIA